MSTRRAAGRMSRASKRAIRTGRALSRQGGVMAGHLPCSRALDAQAVAGVDAAVGGGEPTRPRRGPAALLPHLGGDAGRPGLLGPFEELHLEVRREDQPLAECRAAALRIGDEALGHHQVHLVDEGCPPFGPFRRRELRHHAADRCRHADGVGRRVDGDAVVGGPHHGLHGLEIAGLADDDRGGAPPQARAQAFGECREVPRDLRGRHHGAGRPRRRRTRTRWAPRRPGSSPARSRAGTACRRPAGWTCRTPAPR